MSARDPTYLPPPPAPGEVAYVRRLIAKQHTKAAAKGLRLVPCCGFDSAPFDLGALLVGAGQGILQGGPQGCMQAGLLHSLLGEHAQQRGATACAPGPRPHPHRGLPTCPCSRLRVRRQVADHMWKRHGRRPARILSAMLDSKGGVSGGTAARWAGGDRLAAACGRGCSRCTRACLERPIDTAAMYEAAFLRLVTKLNHVRSMMLIASEAAQNPDLAGGPRQAPARPAVLCWPSCGTGLAHAYCLQAHCLRRTPPSLSPGALPSHAWLPCPPQPPIAPQCIPLPRNPKNNYPTPALHSQNRVQPGPA